MPQPMQDFVMSVRAVSGGKFVADVGPTQFLVVPSGQDPLASPPQTRSATDWYKDVIDASKWRNAANEERGDILFIVHGYNMSEAEVMSRHRWLRDDLVATGFLGVVVSFDWPSGDKALAYLPDRHRAKDSAMKLVTDGISFLSKAQTPDCPINIHVLGHSTGAYVVREAFDDADDTQLKNQAWTVSQIMFAAGDVSTASMSESDGGAESIYRHCVRVTNYSNRHDQVLDLSNVKRLGTEPRAGRIGLPPDAPSKAVNVDCTDYYAALMPPGSPMYVMDQPRGTQGVPSHSWYFGNAMFTRDLLSVLIGQDRQVIPTRAIVQGMLQLQHV